MAEAAATAPPHPRGAGALAAALLTTPGAGAAGAPPPASTAAGGSRGGSSPPTALSPSAALPPPTNPPAPCCRGRRLARPDRGVGAVAHTAIAMTLLLVLAAVLAAVPAAGAAPKFVPKPTAAPSPKKWVPKKPACSPENCITVAKLDAAIKNARLRLIQKEKVPADKAAGIVVLVKAASKPCIVGGKAVSPPTVCFKASAERAVGAAYAALLRKHGKHVTKSTPFGASKKGLTGCTRCERYYFPFGATCCYIGCTSMVNLIGSSTIFLDGCCAYLTGKCEKTASIPSSTVGFSWPGF